MNELHLILFFVHILTLKSLPLIEKFEFIIEIDFGVKNTSWVHHFADHTYQNWNYKYVVQFLF